VCDQCPVDNGSCVEKLQLSRSAADDNSRCTDSPPEDWDCPAKYYLTALAIAAAESRDMDCDSGSVDDCEFCAEQGSCSDDNCPGSIAEDDNAICTD
jgi:hypothetical protein